MKLEWLTNEARTILKRRYLEDGNTPENRYQTICDTIEGISGLEGISDRFKYYIENNWVSFATPVLRSFGEKNNLPISCVDENTWINTIYGGKKAKDIQLGDMVLTHKNRFRKVTKVIPNENKKDIWKLKVLTRMTDLFITGNHEVKTNLGWVRVDQLDKEKHLIAINGKISTNDLTIRSYKNSVSKSSCNSGIKFEDGLTYCPIKTLEKTNEVRNVYDFTVDEDHSFSCSGVVVHNCNKSYCADDLHEILSGLHEVGMLSKYGAGTSVCFSDVRPIGTPISTGGKSEGIMPFLKLYDELISKVSQNSNRRGAMAAYLSVDHPEILSFLDIRSSGCEVKQLLPAVTIPEGWIDSLKNGDADKRKIWSKILKMRAEFGIPYISFLDNANKNKPDVYKDKDMDIVCSNLCVAPETLLLTVNGEFPIKDLDGQTVQVWNGKQWSDSLVSKTGVNQKLLELTFVSYDGSQPIYSKIQCTEYHKFYITNEFGEECELNADELKINDVINFKDQLNNDRTFVLCFKDFKGRYDDTYCVNEPLEHKVVFNGILTGNCNEIYEYCDEEKTFACCLSSVNLIYFDDWKNDPNFIFDMNIMLDCVIEEYIDKGSKLQGLEKAVKFAKDHRAVGLGVLGFHSYLQKNMIPFGSVSSFAKNNEIFSYIRKESDKASQWMAEKWGEPKIMKGYGFRNSTRLAIAPTKTTSAIMGFYSLGIEPIKSNYHEKEIAGVSFTYRNPILTKILDNYNKNTNEIWDSIAIYDGSVQHLDFLSKEEKDVFKTFFEISQVDVVKLAGQRQKFIDQGQSLNLMFTKDSTAKDINKIMLLAHEEGLKGLYYQYSINATKAFVHQSCSSCEG